MVSRNKSKKNVSQEGYGTINFYDIVPKKYLGASIHCKEEKKMNIKLPSRFIVVGASGSCKTNWLMNFITLVDSFDRVTLYAKDTDETLYAFLIDALKACRIQHEVFNDLSEVIPTSEYDPNKNNLVIFDDFNNASKKELEPIKDIYTMGRKKGITAVYIAQTYYNVPKVVRGNNNYLVIFKIQDEMDLKSVIRGNSLGIGLERALEMLEYVRSLGDRHFLLIDKATSNPQLKYRVDWGVKK